MNAQDEELRARNMRHLIALRGEPGALLSPTGRVVAAEPYGLTPARVDVSSDRLRLPDGRDAVLEPLAQGYLLRLPRQRHVRRSVLSLSFLLPEPKVVLDGREVPISLRHAEILCALALQDGLSADQLALRLYGERGNPTTVRAELYRLRAQLGAGALSTRPYRLTADVEADFLAVRAALRDGDVPMAAARYRGALLPRSEAPVVLAERDDLASGVRRAVLCARGRERPVDLHPHRLRRTRRRGTGTAGQAAAAGRRAAGDRERPAQETQSGRLTRVFDPEYLPD